MEQNSDDPSKAEKQRDLVQGRCLLLCPITTRARDLLSKKFLPPRRIYSEKIFDLSGSLTSLSSSLRNSILNNHNTNNNPSNCPNSFNDSLDDVDSDDLDDSSSLSDDFVSSDDHSGIEILLDGVDRIEEGYLSLG
jgi:hypothetical protein